MAFVQSLESIAAVGPFTGERRRGDVAVVVHYPGRLVVLPWFILIHLTALAGLIVAPLPGWRILFGAVALSWIGGIGTTVCYHRALAHRALKLNPRVERILTFCAVFHGSGLPLTWVASHRLHHAEADTPDDISSPIWSGFWWAHLRWLWQADAPPLAKYCPDLASPSSAVGTVTGANIGAVIL